MKTKVSQVLGTWILIRVATKKGIESRTQISGLQGIYRWGEVSELAVWYTVFSMLVKRYYLPYSRLFCLQFDDDYCSGLGCTTLIVCVLLKDETYLCGYWRLVINDFGAMMKITDGFKELVVGAELLVLSSDHSCFSMIVWIFAFCEVEHNFGMNELLMY